MNKLILIYMLTLILILTACDVEEPQELDKGKSTYNAIDMVKEKVPMEMKNKEWFNNQWRQEAIDELNWKVIVGDDTAIWKVSKENNLCSESGEFVSICSDNGFAKTYSNIGYCKPDVTCQVSEDESGISIEQNTNKKQIYYEIVELQDAVPIDDPNYNEKMEDTKTTIMGKYDITKKELSDLIMEGVLNNWPTP